MMFLRPAAERGRANHGWLDTRHTFSFADYYDPRYMGFRALRVLNDDRVQPGQGFGRHPHRDMEIFTWVLEGALAHRDSLGNGSTIQPGDAQRMSAGSGIAHSEFNASDAEPVHFLQIWIQPREPGLPPSYEQKGFARATRENRLALLASPDGSGGSVKLHADARIWGGTFDAGHGATLELGEQRWAWVHAARGHLEVNGQELREGDGVGLGESPTVQIRGLDGGGEVLVFDLA